MLILSVQERRSEVHIENATADDSTIKRTMSPREEGHGGVYADLDKRDEGVKMLKAWTVRGKPGKSKVAKEGRASSGIAGMQAPAAKECPTAT